jgi:toxin YoeB
MMYRVIIESDANLDLDRHIKAGNKNLLEKIHRLLQELELDPCHGIGKPHPLKHYKTNTWSRRIDDRHRMLYTVHENIVTIFVISLWGHYGDK